MCDRLVERVTGATRLDDISAQVRLVMTDATFLGADDAPAHLEGLGPLPAHVARLLATSHNAWIRRVYTDPVDATVTLADTRRRRVDGTVREIATIRDQHCQGIQCASPIRAWDHIEDHSRGGATSLPNAQGLSVNCHRSKEHPQMRVSRDDTGVVTWRTPSGLTWRTLPPPPLGPGSLTRAQIMLRHALRHPPDSALERHLIRYVAHKHRPPQPLQR